MTINAFPFFCVLKIFVLAYQTEPVCFQTLLAQG